METIARVQLNFKQISHLERLLRHYIHTFVKGDYCRACGNFLGTKHSQGSVLHGRHMQGCPVEGSEYLIKLLTKPEPSGVKEAISWSIREWLIKRKEQKI